MTRVGAENTDTISLSHIIPFSIPMAMSAWGYAARAAIALVNEEHGRTHVCHKAMLTSEPDENKRL